MPPRSPSPGWTHSRAQDNASVWTGSPPGSPSGRALVTEGPHSSYHVHHKGHRPSLGLCHCLQARVPKTAWNPNRSDNRHHGHGRRPAVSLPIPQGLGPPRTPLTAPHLARFPQPGQELQPYRGHQFSLVPPPQTIPAPRQWQHFLTPMPSGSTTPTRPRPGRCCTHHLPAQGDCTRLTPGRSPPHQGVF